MAGLLACKQSSRFYRVTGRKVYACHNCGHHISPMVGTILEGSSTSLRQWFYAIFLMAQTRTGISAWQLQRELGVTYKTVWRLFTQIRTLIAQDSAPLFGEVEANETYIGGKHPGKRGRGAAGKTVVFGIVGRDSKAYTEVTPDVKAATLLPIIQEHIPTSPDNIIYAVNGRNNLEEEVQAGITIPPEDSQAMAQAMRRLMAMSPQERVQMGRNGTPA